VARRKARRRGLARNAPEKSRDDVKALLAKRVRELRERAGLSQRDAAHACDLSAVYYGTIERAEKSASIETIEKLAQGLGVPLPELLRFEAPAGSPEPAERLARKIIGLARGANGSKLERFERIARAFFEAE
jgi:transcriptional regulator with XRE-family HTH domain